MNIDRGQIYKITYPNGKIYIGQDRTDDINYFGSANSEIIARDFNRRDRKSFTVTKEVIFEKRHTNIKQLNAKERELIIKYQADNPSIGYNRNRRKK